MILACIMSFGEDEVTILAGNFVDEPMPRLLFLLFSNFSTLRGRCGSGMKLFVFVVVVDVSWPIRGAIGE